MSKRSMHPGTILSELLEMEVARHQSHSIQNYHQLHGAVRHKSVAHKRSAAKRPSSNVIANIVKTNALVEERKESS